MQIKVGMEEQGGTRVWRALIATIALLAVPYPAFADSEQIEEARAWPGDLTEVSPEEDAFTAERDSGKGVAFLASLGSTVMSAVTFPVKMVVGVAGALTGGLAGGMNGGDEKAAAGIWNVTTDGSYYVTPGVLEGQKPFRLTGDHP